MKPGQPAVAAARCIQDWSELPSMKGAIMPSDGKYPVRACSLNYDYSDREVHINLALLNPDGSFAGGLGQQRVVPAQDAVYSADMLRFEKPVYLRYRSRAGTQHIYMSTGSETIGEEES